MRDKSSLHYFEVHAGFVHHTVNANDYTRAEVPGDPAQHLRLPHPVRGWTDIGYNFLVDRFGRIWEGRYGGVDRPVVGAHTLDYNDYSFAMSAIGNYDIKQPSQRDGPGLRRAVRLEALPARRRRRPRPSSGSARSTSRRSTATATPARPPARASTSTPRSRGSGSSRPRRSGAGPGASWSPTWPRRRTPTSSCAGPATARAFVIPTGGLTALRGPVAVATGWPALRHRRGLARPDRRRRGDLVVQAATAPARIRPGTGDGAFGAAVSEDHDGFAGHDLVTAVGDLNGDGRNDLVARDPAPVGSTSTSAAATAASAASSARARLGRLQPARRRRRPRRRRPRRPGGPRQPRAPVAAPGHRRRRLRRPRAAARARGGSIDTITGFGDFTGDGAPDLFVRAPATGYGYVLPGRGDGTFGHALGPIDRRQAASRSIGGGQLTGDGTPDLLARTRRHAAGARRTRGTFETGTPIATGVRSASANAAASTPATGTATASATSSPATSERRALRCAAATAPATSAAPIRIGTGFGKVGLLAAVGDMTGDGWPDLMGQPAGRRDPDLPRQRARRAAGPATSPTAAIDASRQVAVGRWDGDGAPDILFRKGNQLTLFPGNGPAG